MSNMLNEIEKLPDDFIEVKADQLLELLGRPTLIHLQGENPRPLFICTLLHGNETTGFYAVQKILKKYQQQKLPRSLSIFIGNVEAAAVNLRRLDRQADFNRIWPGTEEDYLAEAHMMKQVVEIMSEKNVFASIDIHNNTGLNPHYGCINVLDKKYLALAGLFSNTVVYFTSPKGVQSAAFARICPSVTLECGQSGQMDGVSHAAGFLDMVLNMDDFSVDVPEHINLYHTVARVYVPEKYSFGFSDDATINFYPDIEMYNFVELGSGKLFASIEPESQAFLQVLDDNDKDVSDEYFSVVNNQIVLAKTVMPSMLTVNTAAIRQDCLCYLMEKISIPDQRL
ncbi:MAG: M14 family metallopeptidase [Gammaproteobacteria bacterium]|nr:M14 family metallopeptidase [Gammaproteobacteria bacterium]MCW8910020.1 M14 family metallopeptidase [Gammaproteobacteria bacterium]MCW9006013.1 M14 family metallopeptidase [Gammaproteobacteria bacterium]MCW9056822.1 M14 family metallopeptidase [Gammaproteobacteria bacterium]